jgi:hypothetical protein
MVKRDMITMHLHKLIMLFYLFINLFMFNIVSCLGQNKRITPLLYVMYFVKGD